MKISKIYTYPIKSLRGVELSEAILTKHGFAYDRRFMLVKVVKDEDGSISYKNMAVSEFAEMVLFFTSLDIPEDSDAMTGVVHVTYKPPTGESDSLEIPLRPETGNLEEIEITMHRSPTRAYRMEPKYCDWFSSHFGYEVNLVYLGDNLRKVLMTSSGNAAKSQQEQPQSQTNGSGASGWLSSLTTKATELVMTAAAAAGATNGDAHITFADCAPYLVVSEKSMDDVHSRLPDDEQMDITKFRPGIIVAGAADVWEEDYWGELTIAGETKILCEQNCGRCKSINVDFATGAPGTGEAGSMLKKLNKDRRVDRGTKWSPIFGRYSFLPPGSEGSTIRVGDEVVVSRKNSDRTRFDWEGLCTQ